jgi:Mg2+-importing ATPase
VARENYGANTIRTSKQPTLAKRLKEAFVNPFTGILLLLAIVSTFTNIIYAEPGDRNPATVIIICVMVLASGLLHFIQDTRSNNAAAKLSAMISTTATVKRLNEPPTELALDDLVPGDIIKLAAGDMLPADIRILSAKDLFINQAALTGESVPVEKTGATVPEAKSLTEMANLAFMGSSV